LTPKLVFLRVIHALRKRGDSAVISSTADNTSSRRRLIEKKSCSGAEHNRHKAVPKRAFWVVLRENLEGLGGDTLCYPRVGGGIRSKANKFQLIGPRRQRNEANLGKRQHDPPGAEKKERSILRICLSGYKPRGGGGGGQRLVATRGEIRCTQGGFAMTTIKSRPHSLRH